MNRDIRPQFEPVLDAAFFGACVGDVALQTIVETTAELLDTPEAVVIAPTTDGVIVLANSAGSSGEIIQDAPLSMEAITSGQTVERAPEQPGIGCIAAAPICVEGHGPIAAVVLRGGPDSTLTAYQNEKLTRMARLAASSMERTLREQEARLAGRSFESLFEATIAGTILMTPHRSPDGTIIDMRMTRVNEAACSILGIPREDWEGTLHLDTFPASAENGIVQEYIRVFETGVPYRQQFHYADARLNGWYDVTCVRTDTGVAVTFLDVTKNIQDQLDATEKKRTLELFVKHTPGAVAVFDKEMRYIIASNRWSEDYQLDAENLVGQSHYEIFPETTEEQRAIHQRGLQGEVISNPHDRFERADGSVDWVKWAIHPWHDASGSIGGLIMFSEVITKQHEAELALRENQRSLALALDCGNIVMWDMNLEDNSIVCSDLWYDMLGLDREDDALDLDRWLELIHPEDRENALSEFDRLLGGDSSEFRHEYRLMSRVFGYIWVEEVGRIVEVGSDGVPTRALGTLQNISARRESQEIVNASERRLNLSLECAEVGLWDWNIASGDVLFSPTWWTQLGYDPAKPPFKPGIEAWESLTHPDDLPIAKQRLEQHFKGETSSYQAEFRMLRQDGTYVWLRGSGRVVERDASGAPTRVLGVNLDINDLYEAQRSIEQFANDVADAKSILEDQASELAAKNADLEDARRTAVAANQAKSEFLANMSHEIRTPMTAILGYAELLDDATIPESERTNYTQTIIRNGQHLLSVINDILDISRIEAGRMTTERLDCSPREILDSVVKLMKSKADEKNLDLVLSCDADVPPVCHTDPTRLRQILLNLVGNAIKFTERGSVTIRCALAESDSDPQKICFDVQDTGIGVPSDRVEALFKPFSQTDTSHTRRFGGTGLGLTISARLAGLLGGSVRLLESRPGNGSTFRAEIEIGRPQVSALESTYEQKAQRTESPAHVPESLQGRILVAEDGIDNQRLIRHHLSKAGAHVDLVDNGMDAVETASEALSRGEPYDLILMDMQMPVMDGLTATGKLRDSGYTRPIVALTAHAMDSQRQECLDGGCDDHLAKPISKPTLLAACQHWMSKSARQSA